MIVNNRKRLLLLNLKIVFVTVITKIIYDLCNDSGFAGPALLFIFIPIFYLVAIQFIISSSLILLFRKKNKQLCSELSILGLVIVCGINFFVFNVMIWYLDMDFNSGSSFAVAILYLGVLFYYWNKEKKNESEVD